MVYGNSTLSSTAPLSESTSTEIAAFPPSSASNSYVNEACLDGLLSPVLNIYRHYAYNKLPHMKDIIQPALSFGCRLAELVLSYGLSLDKLDSMDVYILPLVLVKSMDSRPMVNPEICQSLNRFCKLFLVYGSVPDIEMCRFASVCFKSKPPYLTDVASCILKMVDNRTLCRFSHCNKAFKGVRSLQELCRYELYRLVPNRRMAEHKDKLPLPTPVKQFLIFE